MTTLFDKLNLRPQERRLVMLAMVILFVVVNFWLVFPHFGEWRSLRAKLQTARKTTEVRLVENAKLAAYKDQLANLQEQGGQIIQPGDQAALLMETVNREAIAANISAPKLSPVPGSGSIPNNPFFTEQRVQVTGTAGELELVNFLRRIGAGTALLRVQNMDLKPEAGNHRLVFTLTVVGNYLKTSAPKPKPAARTPTAPAAAAKEAAPKR
jgi:Tfp pilus assembly protein PilO